MDQSEIKVVCAQCSYPEIVVFKADGTYDHTEWAPDAPKDEEEALSKGWVEIECGMLCPPCAAMKAAEDEADAKADAKSGGLDMLAEYVGAEKKP